MKKQIDFFQNGLCYHCHIAQSELHEFNQFHDETESMWLKKDNKIQDSLSKILNKYTEEHHQEIIENHSWELHLNQSKYPNIHRESLIITIYNFLESRLNQLCLIISESVNSKINLNDLQGKGIERAFLYLSKIADFDLSKMGCEMPYIKNVNVLRNQIVHNGGLLPKDVEHKLNKFVLKNSTLSGKPGNNVSLSYEFISEFIKLLIEFFDKLDKEIQKFINRSL